MVDVYSGVECTDVTFENTYIPGCLEICKYVDLDDYVFADTVDTTFTFNITGPNGYVNNDVVVPWNDCIQIDDLYPGQYTIVEEDPGPAWVTDPADRTRTVNVESGIDCALAEFTNTLLIPKTTISIEADVFETTPGGNVWLRISEHNDGQVPLTSPSVTLIIDTVPAIPDLDLYKGDAYWSPGPSGTPPWDPVPGDPNGDANDDGILDVDETWYWAVQVTLWEDADITVIGHGTDPLGNPVDGESYPGEPGTYPTETDEITVEVSGATRTWGFWKTHLWLVQWMFAEDQDPMSPYYNDTSVVTLPINLGTWPGDPSPKLIDTVCEYMGLMWSKQSQNSDGGKREKIDAARVHTAHQALAAIMNYYMPGGAPLPAGITLESIAGNLTNGTIQEIRQLGSTLANYNESGDDVALDPSMPPTGRTNNADPQGARLVGEPCEEYWDTPEAIRIRRSRGRR
jgi:hypothetical protein